MLDGALLLDVDDVRDDLAQGEDPDHHRQHVEARLKRDQAEGEALHA
jgi:hypothetical protein